MRSFTFAALASTALVAATSMASAADITIKFSHVLAESTPKGQMALKFEELVEERLPGRVDVEVFPSSQLYTDDASLPALIFNDIQLVAVSLSKFKKYTPALQLFDLPFLFPDMEAVERFQASPEGQELLTSLDGSGIVGLGYLHNGLKQMSANTPLLEPSDAEGLKFRIQSSDVLAAQFDALDAAPLKKPFSEVFVLLQTKAIDGQENTWSNIYSRKFHEVQDHITVTNHGVIEHLVASNEEFWNNMPDDVKPVVEEALQEAIAYGNELSAAKDAEGRANVEASGYATVHEITPEQRAMWVEAMRPVWEQFEAEIGPDMINAAANAGS
ncbi:MAG: TRAP transporter substrate-binding protein [Pseudomonadota bacterium]